MGTKRILSRPGVILALGLAVWSVPAAVQACKCKDPGSPKHAASTSTFVFEGRAGASSEDGRGSLRTTEFEVLRVFKGESCDRVEIETRGHSSSCGKAYENGETYLIYAREVDGQFRDGECHRSRLSADAAADFAALGEGSAPTCVAETAQVNATGDAAAVEPASPSDSTEEPGTIEADPQPDEPAPTKAGPPPVEENSRSCSSSILAASPSPWALSLVLIGLFARRRRFSGGSLADDSVRF